VLYFHGIQSHGGWSEESGHHLAAAGFTVLMPDRRGSGLNQASRGHASSLRQCIDDAGDALGTLLAMSGQAAAHVVGVSWGGKAAVCLAAQEPARVASLSLVAPGLFPRVDLTAAEKFRVAMSLINHPDQMFDIPLNDPRFFTANPERIRQIEADPLMLRQVSASFLLATRRMDRVVQRFVRSAWRGPVHLMLAGHDPIIHNDRTRAWLRELRSEDLRITEYPDGHHTLEFEPDPEPFLDDLVSWITERCGKSA
jgi:alpha-beta hydrolase superfamily lysophospholipase